jgi:hypothetical protein
MAIEEAVQVVLAVVDQMDKMDIFSLSGRDFLHKVFSSLNLSRCFLGAKSAKELTLNINQLASIFDSVR